ncbi:deoxyribonuclease gamma-like [Menidia menidia]
MKIAAFNVRNLGLKKVRDKFVGGKLVKIISRYSIIVILEVQGKGNTVYEDEQEGDEDAFAREPFIVRFKCPKAAVEDLVLIPIHTKPDDSEKEIDELDDVVREVEKYWKTKNIMILGDFNADGPYMSRRKLNRSRLRSNKYHWVIKDKVDTTVRGSNDHTYDRIVVYGEALKDAIVANSGKPYNFDKALRLSNKNALRISDHYPVEVKLKAKRRRS